MSNRWLFIFLACETSTQIPSEGQILPPQPKKKKKANRANVPGTQIQEDPYLGLVYQQESE